MSPHEKAVNAVNLRLERLQVNLGEARDTEATKFLFQSIVVLLGLTEALNDYIAKVGAHVRRRHDSLKEAGEAATTKHADLLRSGQELLERFRANPTDRALRREIEQAQRAMESIQRQMRREADGLQRELAPPVAMIDEAAVTVRRLAEVEDPEGLRRLLKATIEQVRELYAANRTLPKGLVDAAGWEQAALAALGQAAGFQDAYARALYQAILALEWMALTVSESPLFTAEEAVRRADEAAAARVQAITTRLAQTPEAGGPA